MLCRPAPIVISTNYMKMKKYKNLYILNEQVDQIAVSRFPAKCLGDRAVEMASKVRGSKWVVF